MTRYFRALACSCLFVVLLWAGLSARAAAHEGEQGVCPRPAPGETVPEPQDLRSENGVLQVELTVRDEREKDGSTRFCYLLANGSQAPTLRLRPGDQIGRAHV